MSFDPQAFLDMQFTQENDTKIIPIPIGEYTAIIDDVKMAQWVKKDDPSTTGFRLDVKYAIDDAGVKALLGRESVGITDGILLDLLPDGSGLDMGRGKNVALGRLREAVGLNTPGEPFSFRQLPGRVVKISIKHEMYQDNIQSRVKGVTKLS